MARRESYTSFGSMSEDIATTITSIYKTSLKSEYTRVPLSSTQTTHAQTQNTEYKKQKQRQRQRQHAENSMSYQITFLQQQKEELEEQSRTYHELIESISYAKKRNQELKQQLDEITGQYSEDNLVTHQMKTKVDDLKSHKKQLVKAQNERDIRVINKEQTLKSMIVQDQEDFAVKENIHEQTFIDLKAQRERNRQLEEQIAKVEEKLHQMTEGSSRSSKSHQKFLDSSNQQKSDRVLVNGLKEEVDRLKKELVALLRREEKNVRQIKRYQRNKSREKNLHEETTSTSRMDASLSSVDEEKEENWSTNNSMLSTISPSSRSHRENSSISQHSHKSSVKRLRGRLAKRLNNLATR